MQDICSLKTTLLAKIIKCKLLMMRFSKGNETEHFHTLANCMMQCSNAYRLHPNPMRALYSVHTHASQYLVM